MNKIIQNLISIVTGFLSNLTTTNKSNLVAAINEVNAKSSSGGITSVVAGTNVTVDDTDPANPIVSAHLPYKLIAGYISNNFSDSTIVIFDQLINTSGINVVFSRTAVGDYLFTADSGLFGSTFTSQIFSIIPPLDSNTFSLTGSGKINYMYGEAPATDTSSLTYRITVGNPTDGLLDGLIPQQYYIEIKIYPSPL